MEPPNDGCVGSFVVKPVASIDFNIPSTSKDKGRFRKSKRKEKMLSRRALSLQGSAIVKSSGT